MLDSEDAFGSSGSAPIPAGFYASPVHPRSNGQFMKPSMNAMNPTPPQYLPPPPYAYAENQFSGNRMPMVPVNQYVGYPHYSQIPPDPRSFPYASNSPVHPGLYSLPPAHMSAYTMNMPEPPFQPASYSPYKKRKAHRSQPAVRRRSLSDSSDSDEAQEISDRIMRSSDDPRELRRIMKSARKPRKQRPRSEKPPKREPSMDGLAVVYDEDEIPAGRYDSWFDEDRHSMDPMRTVKPPKQKESKRGRPKGSTKSQSRHKGRIPSKSPKRSKSRQKTSIQPDTSVLAIHSPRKRTPQVSNDKQTVWWNATTTGKRQRLPPCDWRKGERYISAPDGTKVGLTGWKEIVCDDMLGWKHRNKKRADRRAGLSTADEEEEVAVPKSRRSSASSKRSSVASSVSSEPRKMPSKKKRNIQIPSQDVESWGVVPVVEAPEESLSLNVDQGQSFGLEQRQSVSPQSSLLQAFDFMKKNKAGIYCLGSFKLLHRRGDRKWGQHDQESGFTTCPSISTREMTFAEVALDANMPFGKMETLDSKTSIVIRVVKAAPNAIRIQINKDEERLNEEDELRIEPGATYSLTNLSKERTAVISMLISH